MSKKVLIFSTAYYPFVGGAEVAVKEITDMLTSDFEFDLITARMKKDLASFEKIGTVSVYRVGFGHSLLDKLLLPFLGAYTALRLESKHHYICFWGIMVTFGTGAAYICNILRRLVGKKKIPIVLTLQEGDSESHLQYRWGGLIGLSWKLALRYCDFVTAISTFLLYRAERMGYSGPQALVPNGVDLSLFSAIFSNKEKEDMRKMLSKKEGEVFLVSVSRLVHKNAVDDIISALTHLPPHVSLMVLGVGQDGPKLSEQAHKLGLSERVKFLGFVSHTSIPKYFSVCDVFVRPSRSEGFGNSFIEAMAAGLPVVATPVGGIPDFIDDKETGVFSAPDNPQSLAHAIRLVLEDSTLTKKITTAACARVTARYGWDRVAGEMKNVFDEFVD